MAEKKKLIVLITRGLDDERSSVAWSIANTAVPPNTSEIVRSS